MGYYINFAAQLHRARDKAREVLPLRWLTGIAQAARAAIEQNPSKPAPLCELEVYEHWIKKYAGADRADLSESDIRERAETIALRARRVAPKESIIIDFVHRYGGRLSHDCGLKKARDAMDVATTLAKVAQGKITVELIKLRDIKPTSSKSNFLKIESKKRKVEKLINNLLYLEAKMEQAAQDVELAADKFVKHWTRRINCARWWRGQLRRWVAQNYERGEIELGLVGAAHNKWYCSDRAVRRRAQQLAASEAMMKATFIENQLGEKVTLWDASNSTTANKSNRRGELMTRIKGCEEYASEAGLVGMFTTNTAPSRFHAQKKGGGRNIKYDGSTPDMAQAWLNETWQGCRAQLHREGVRVMGFRVVEPHHDGCPHWHMLLFVEPLKYDRAAAIMGEHWRREPERGSDKNRIKIKRMIGGMAAGYIAKYIAKNIDDYKIDHHFDHGQDGEKIMCEGVNPIERVDAWASTWRIRQFQAVGQPPVTVWRGLRRVTREAAAGGSDTLIKAWLSVHRKGECLACWRGYMAAQGGAMLKRKEYKLCQHTIDKQVVGRYGDTVQAWASGIKEAALAEGFATPSKRMQWGAEGFSSTRSVETWTRLNNCTRAKNANRKNIGVASFDESKNRGNPLDDWDIDPAKAAQFDDFWASQTFNCHQ